jgi:alpha-ribazole phosphatase
MEIYLIRHTTPKISKGICYGRSEVQLADTFYQEAESLRKILPETFDIVFSSPSQRCYQLARLLRAKKRLGDDRLLEMDFGDWEMKAWDTIDKNNLDVWMKHFVTMRVPNGESFMDLHDRVNEFIKTLVTKSYKNTAIVTHAGVIRCLVAKALQIPLTEAFGIPIAFASVTKLLANEDGSFEKMI